MKICIECWEPVNSKRDVVRHAHQHHAGVDQIPVEACPKCYGHPAHPGRRCNMPVGYLGVVQCYCVMKKEPA